MNYLNNLKLKTKFMVIGMIVFFTCALAIASLIVGTKFSILHTYQRDHMEYSTMLEFKGQEYFKLFDPESENIESIQSLYFLNRSAERVEMGMCQLLENISFVKSSGILLGINDFDRILLRVFRVSRTFDIEKKDKLVCAAMKQVLDDYLEKRTGFDEFKEGFIKNIEAITVNSRDVAGLVDRATALLAFVVIGIFLCSTAITFFILIVVDRNIRRLDDATALAQTLAEGDLRHRIDLVQKDEIGIMINSMNRISDSINRMIKEIASKMEMLVSSSAELKSISNDMAAGSQQTAGRSNSVAGAAEAMSINMKSVAVTIERASSNMDIVADAIETNTSAISKVVQNTEEAKMITDDAVSMAGTTSGKVEKLGKAADNISRVTETITDISEQTNLLALNATIEAARAGESGKGFGVVAGEIKELARQTSEATLEIKGLVEEVQNTARDTVSEITQITGIIDKSNDIVNSISSDIEEQSLTIRQIAERVNQTSEGMKEVNENIMEGLSVSQNIAGDISVVNTDAAGISDAGLRVQESAETLSVFTEEIREKVGLFKTIDS